MLGGIIPRIVKANTPPEQHGTTLVCLRKEFEDFRDVLRIHNVMAGYVFLLDGIGRVRFAGSGEATEEELERLIRFAKELVPDRNHAPARNQRGRKSKGGRRR